MFIHISVQAGTINMANESVNELSTMAAQVKNYAYDLKKHCKKVKGSKKSIAMRTNPSSARSKSKQRGNYMASHCYPCPQFTPSFYCGSPTDITFVGMPECRPEEDRMDEAPRRTPRGVRVPERPRIVCRRPEPVSGTKESSTPRQEKKTPWYKRCETIVGMAVAGGLVLCALLRDKD